VPFCKWNGRVTDGCVAGGLYDYKTKDSCAGPRGITFRIQPINKTSSTQTPLYDMKSHPERRFKGRIERLSEPNSNSCQPRRCATSTNHQFVQSRPQGYAVSVLGRYKGVIELAETRPGWLFFP
jgi:hypothetical protein